MWRCKGSVAELHSKHAILVIIVAAVFGFPLVFPESYWITVLIYVGIYGLVVVG